MDASTILSLITIMAGVSLGSYMIYDAFKREKELNMRYRDFILIAVKEPQVSDFLKKYKKYKVKVKESKNERIIFNFIEYDTNDENTVEIHIDKESRKVLKVMFKQGRTSSSYESA